MPKYAIGCEPLPMKNNHSPYGRCCSNCMGCDLNILDRQANCLEDNQWKLWNPNKSKIPTVDWEAKYTRLDAESLQLCDEWAVKLKTITRENRRLRDVVIKILLEAQADE